MLPIDSFKYLLWFWYIYQNKTASETHQELMSYMVQAHQVSCEVVGETCPHDILSYVPSLRTTQRLFQEWNFRKGSQLRHLSQDQQLCHRIWLLFYDLGLNDQEILRFLIKEQYTIDLRVYVLL